MFTSFIPMINGMLSEGVPLKKITPLIAAGILNGFQITDELNWNQIIWQKYRDFTQFDDNWNNETLVINNWYLFCFI